MSSYCDFNTETWSLKALERLSQIPDTLKADRKREKCYRTNISNVWQKLSKKMWYLIIIFSESKLTFYLEGVQQLISRFVPGNLFVQILKGFQAVSILLLQHRIQLFETVTRAPIVGLSREKGREFRVVFRRPRRRRRRLRRLFMRRPRRGRFRGRIRTRGFRVVIAVTSH